MKRSTFARASALALLMVIVLAACGQKGGVHEEDTFFAGAPGGEGGGIPGDTTTDPNDPDGGVLPPGVVPTDGTGGDTGGGGTGGGGAVAGDRTGITDTEITIGLHAPLTGAAPIEPKAFSKGKDLYWRFLQEVQGKKVHGRTVKVVFRDDAYTPSTAVNVCNQMAQQDKAFLLIGGAGTDQINACAGYADPRQIPYLSPGVQTAGLENRRSYFAVSMTYKQQMPLLIDLLKAENAKSSLNKYGPAQVMIGHVRPNTPNFDDADDALKAAAAKAGFGYKAYTVVKEGNAQEAQTVAAQMGQDDVDVVVPITAPTFTTQLAINTGKNQYFPRYAGVGITNNVNQMINRACDQNEFQNALFFSPWPGWKQVMQGQFDPDFKAAANQFAPDVNTRDKGGDILIALWGIMKTVHQMLEVAGPDMTRQSFIETMGSFKLALKVFPTVDYAASKPFGAQDVHVLIGKCNEPADSSNGVQGGAQFVSHPDYKGLQRKF